MSLNQRILRILISVSGSEHIHVDGLRSRLRVERAELHAALRRMEQQGGVEFLPTRRQYVRATRRWFTA